MLERGRAQARINRIIAMRDNLLKFIVTAQVPSCHRDFYPIFLDL